MKDSPRTAETTWPATMKALSIAFYLLIASWPRSALDAAPPNIVLIVADDLGYGDVGCYGSRINSTPHIDRLAAHGLRFTDFHSAGPMCTPTRAAMLTGRYQQRFGRRFDGPLSGRRNRNQGLPLEAVTIAEVLKKKGYATGCFGKWHLGYVPPWLPPSQGFDEFRGLGSGDGDHHTRVDRWGRKDWWHDNAIAHEEGYTAELLTKHTIDFITRHRSEPFFAYVPHLAIHFPWQGPEDPPHRVAGKSYENDKWGIVPDPANVTPHVKAMVESVDKSVGEIVAALERFQLERRTLVIFTSDNGGYLTYGSRFKNISSNGVLRGQKGSLYEGGHRVPAVAYWPGTITPAITDAVANSIDLLPTFASLADASTDGLPLDGIDLSRLLKDGTPIPERTLFWRAGSGRAVRSGPWKLHATKKQTELFNLESDLREQNDLSEEQPELKRKLLEAWAHWEADVDRSARDFGRPDGSPEQSAAMLHLQKTIDQAAPYSVLQLDRSQTVTLSTPLVIDKPLTVQGLNARLPDGLGKTPLVVVRVAGVAMTDFTLRGNADTVPQSERAPLLSIAAGEFRVERGRFVNSAKDGVEIVPLEGSGDIVGGVVRDVVGDGVIRDVVSISGGEFGAQVKNVLVENVRGYNSRSRGVVEVSDGTDNITVRKVFAESSVYAIDVQDHGKPAQTNRNVVIEDVYARDCRHAIRTANRPQGHKGLSMRNITAERCVEPIRISNTAGVYLSNVRIVDHQARQERPRAPISFRDCDGVSVRDVTVQNSSHSGAALLIEDCDQTLVDGFTLKGQSATLANAVLYRVTVAKTFSGLRIRNVAALRCRQAGIRLEVRHSDEENALNPFGTLTDYIVAGNVARVEDNIKGERGLVENNVPVGAERAR